MVKMRNSGLDEAQAGIKYMYIYGGFMSLYDKNHYNIVKWLASN